MIRYSVLRYRSLNRHRDLQCGRRSGNRRLQSERKTHYSHRSAPLVRRKTRRRPISGQLLSVGAYFGRGTEHPLAGHPTSLRRPLRIPERPRLGNCEKRNSHLPLPKGPKHLPGPPPKHRITRRVLPFSSEKRRYTPVSDKLSLSQREKEKERHNRSLFLYCITFSDSFTATSAGAMSLI